MKGLQRVWTGSSAVSRTYNIDILVIAFGSLKFVNLRKDVRIMPQQQYLTFIITRNVLQKRVVTTTITQTKCHLVRLCRLECSISQI